MKPKQQNIVVGSAKYLTISDYPKFPNIINYLIFIIILFCTVIVMLPKYNEGIIYKKII